MAKNSFRIIGIKAVSPHIDEFLRNSTIYHDKVEAIQKVLYGTNKWYYFYKGISISEDNSQVEMTSEAKKDFSLFDAKGLKISLCAVVGRNGTGKSTIVELLVRTINNLATALLGEGYNFSAAEHLHFIDNVFADLCFQIGNVVYILTAHGRHVKLELYKAKIEHYFKYRHVKTYNILDQYNIKDSYVPLKKHREGRRILKSLFYTMVCNYSLYGFNYRDFISEATPAARLQALRVKANDKHLTEDSVWLKGIFHKNDGYQTPIVLHPMREDGRLNVVKENVLAKERLSALLFYKDTAGNYPLRTINGDLHVIALHIRPTQNKKFSQEYILDILDISTRQNVNKNYEHVRNLILSFWDEKYDILILSGGDGTLSKSLSQLYNEEIEFPDVAIFPTGTSNDLAKSLNLGDDVKKWVDNIVNGKAKPLDFGLINNKTVFLSSYAGGLFTKVSYNTDKNLKKVIGKTAYHIAGLAELTNIRKFDLNITLDSGEKISEQAILYMILNGKSVGGFDSVIDNADMNDGLMNILIVKNIENPFDLPAVLLDLINSNLENNDYVRTVTAKSCVIEKIDDEVGVSIDGEEGKNKKAEIRFISNRLKIFRQ